MSQDPNDLWAQCPLSIEQRLRPQTFNTWFRPTRVRQFDSHQLIIEVPSSYFADWLETRYLESIRDAVRAVCSCTPDISFAVADAQGPAETPGPGPVSSSTPSPPATPPTSPSLPSQAITAESAAAPPVAAAPPPDASPFSPLNERYTFDTFVIGEGNRFAHAAALAVAQSPGRTQFNPLVIYGGVGLGKTHLLQAIGHHAQQHNPGLRVAFVPSEKFMSDFIEAIKTRRTAQFRSLYRSPDILLIDDIQFFLKAEATQDEFFHTFNALHQSGRQIVMTCDTAPGQLAGMEERLVSRFQWGLVTPIEPPDLETRIAILHQKAEINAIPLPDEVAVFLGNYISSNIRELEGALIHLMAYCSVNQTELSIHAAKQIIQERLPTHSAELSIEFIQRRVADHFALTPDLLTGKSRKQTIAHARHLAMYLAKRLTHHSLKVIGLHFGNRDHSTVLHAIRTVEARCATDRHYARTVQQLEESLQPESR